LTIRDNIDCRNILVTNSSTLTIDSRSHGGAILLTAQNLFVDAGSRISADALGYTNRNGPGAGSSSNRYGGGAGYGGDGGGGVGWQRNILWLCYPSITDGQWRRRPELQRRFGGVMEGVHSLHITGTAQLSGTISANGEAGYYAGCGSGYDGSSGGGSGGSILINVNNLTGNGTLQANGGYGGGYGGGGGAGGRIVVYYSRPHSVWTESRNPVAAPWGDTR